nr:hypothetical protein [Tanacetum cinerariifolium]
MSRPPLVAKPKKGKSQTVTSTSPKSQGPEASGALSKKSKRPKSKTPSTESKVTPPKPTKGSEQSHSVSLVTIHDPQDLERVIHLASTGLPSTLDEGTRKSKPLPEGTFTHPKDSGGNVKPLDRDLTFMTSDEGTTKTTPRTGAKYQEDQTQSSRLRYQSLAGNEGEPSYEGEPDTQHMLLTCADVRAILLFEDEAQESKEDILGGGEEMDDNPQDQSDKLVEAFMSSLEKSSTIINYLYKCLEVITQLVKDITKSVKDDLDKEEEIKKAEEKARLNAISKTEVIKVVRKEAKKLGIHPKKAITTKAGELFKKAQDAEHEVLKIQHTEK